jgi:hypothetical protein
MNKLLHKVSRIAIVMICLGLLAIGYTVIIMGLLTLPPWGMLLLWVLAAVTIETWWMP